jgi:hypothetical protein
LTLGVGAAIDSRRRALVAFTVLAAIAWVTLMVFARETTFRGDDWDLVANRSLSDPIGWMRPFNEQWIAVPAVIFRLIFGIVGMHSYLPYLGVLLALHVVSAAAVWRIVSQLSGIVPGLAAATVVLFLGAGCENLYQAFQIGMVLSTAAGLWAIAIFWFDRRPGLAGLLLIVSVASHSIGAVFVGVAVILALAEWRKSNAWLLIPIAALIVWTLAFDLPSLAARGGSFSSSVVLLPGFVLAGILTAFGAVFGSSGAVGVCVLASLAVIGLRLKARPAHPPIAVAALCGLAAEYALIGVSRAELGLGVVTWSRYLYVAVPLALIVIAGWFGEAPTLPARWRRSASVALVGLAVVAILGNLRAYALSNDTTADFVHRERAAAAVVNWSLDVRRPPFDVHMPAPAELRALMAQYGGPIRDDWFPGVVPAVPKPIAEDVCAQMLLDITLQPACEGAISAEVGSGN